MRVRPLIIADSLLHRLRNCTIADDAFKKTFLQLYTICKQSLKPYIYLQGKSYFKIFTEFGKIFYLKGMPEYEAYYSVLSQIDCLNILDLETSKVIANSMFYIMQNIDERNHLRGVFNDV